MKLQNEYDLDWPMTMSLAWAYLWRLVIIGLPVGIIVQILQALDPGLSMQILALLFQLAGLFVVAVLATRWLFGSGHFGSIRIILMEEAHYQELVSNHEHQPTAEAEAG